ncbi:MAG: class I SAM-dependent methyltransferase [Clostridia bacterium]|nr:class I SAM-dependent methyltransferase [Clostridia bacterium]
MEIELKARNIEMKEFFDEKADGYDNVHLPMMDNKRPIAAVLDEGTKRVLDLGVGTGLELIPLFERFPEANVTGVDISANMLEYVGKRDFADRVTCVVGDFFEVDFGGGYDAVISSAALHHFAPTDKARLYAKIAAALKPGGLFINSDRFCHTVEEQEENFVMLRDNPYHMRHIDTPLATSVERELLLEAGFGEPTFDALADERYLVMIAKKL